MEKNLSSGKKKKITAGHKARPSAHASTCSFFRHVLLENKREHVSRPVQRLQPTTLMSGLDKSTYRLQFN